VSRFEGERAGGNCVLVEVGVFCVLCGCEGGTVENEALKEGEVAILANLVSAIEHEEVSKLAFASSFAVLVCGYLWICSRN
jgi:hypothetical protein